MPTPTDYLGSAEVCARLRIDRSTLSRWVATGRITPVLKMPGVRGAFLFEESEVARLERDLAQERAS